MSNMRWWMKFTCRRRAAGRNRRSSVWLGFIYLRSKVKWSGAAMGWRHGLAQKGVRMNMAGTWRGMKAGVVDRHGGEAWRGGMAGSWRARRRGIEGEESKGRGEGGDGGTEGEGRIEAR